MPWRHFCLGFSWSEWSRPRGQCTIDVGKLGARSRGVISQMELTSDREFVDIQEYLPEIGQ